MNPKRTVIIISLFLLFLTAYGSMFVVHQVQQVLVLQFGDPKRVIKDPGLKFKLPLIQNTVDYDKRVLDYDLPVEEIIASDQKRLVVDPFARYKILDPLKFYQTVRNENGIRNRLNSIIIAALRRVVGGVQLSSLLTDKRQSIMSDIRDEVNREAQRFGIEVIDVRIRRADLPEANSLAIYDRMESEREKEAREYRAQGQEASKRIRSIADRDKTVILAQARKKAQILRGEGDSQSIKIYANAFKKDPEFFMFYRSMQAYKESLSDESTTMVLSPNSDFFKYFNNILRIPKK
ncbi:MAG: protease modulator HflC [Pseudomonadota bacterium]|nr:protease modulator HflC [Pseudomonadota bacterium]